MYELTAGTVIENGAEASCILAGCKGIQFVSVTFCGKMPESWTALGDDGDNWANLPVETAKAMAADLGTAIRKGYVENVWISFEPWGEDYMLNADFENGWARKMRPFPSAARRLCRKCAPQTIWTKRRRPWSVSWKPDSFTRKCNGPSWKETTCPGRRRKGGKRDEQTQSIHRRQGGYHRSSNL